MKTPSDEKGTKLRLTNAAFDAGADGKRGAERRSDKTTAAGTEDGSDNRHTEPFRRESFFDPDSPDGRDEISGASKTGDPEDRISLRAAYGVRSIWSGRRWMAEPQTKKRKTV